MPFSVDSHIACTVGSFSVDWSLLIESPAANCKQRQYITGLEYRIGHQKVCIINRHANDNDWALHTELEAFKKNSERFNSDDDAERLNILPLLYFRDQQNHPPASHCLNFKKFPRKTD